MHMCMRACMWMHVSVHACAGACVYMFMRVVVNAHVHACMHVDACVSVHACAGACVYMCVYVMFMLC